MSPTAQLADKVSGFLGSRFSRRGFFARSAVVGSAVAANPLTYALTPTDAYAAVCSCSGSNCECGSTCCDGYTEFCCTLTGNNQCPPGSLLGGWWKVDGSGFCNGPRYYMDCNAPCNGCGCGGGGICSGGCSGTNCGCGLGDCNNRKAGCVNFRYGQCNQQVSCIGPILCRVVTCIAPWEIDGTCTTTARYDANTAYHDRPCLHGQTGSLDLVQEVGNGVRLAGWALDWDTNAPITIRVTVDGQVVATPLANLARSDIANAYPGMGPNHGYDVTVPISGGTHTVCAAMVNTGPGQDSLLGCRTVTTRSPFGSLDALTVGNGSISVGGWALDPDTTSPIQVHVYVGSQGTAIVADQPRPDVDAAYGKGPNHGFNATIPAAPGVQQIFVYAINTGVGSNVLIAQRTVEIGLPFGALERADAGGTGTAGGVKIRGWAVDPDVSGPIPVHVYVGGVGTAIIADKVRNDLVPGPLAPYGATHGFEAIVPGPTGRQTVDVYAINDNGPNRLIASRSVDVISGAPFGSVDLVRAGPGTVRVAGWVLDPDSSDPTDVHVYIGDTGHAVRADLSRSDIGTIYPGYGVVHGFDAVLPAPSGWHNVCIYGIDVGPGENRLLGCRNVLVGGDPFGSVDFVRVVAGQVSIGGWAIDPDTADPIDVHVYVDSSGRAFTANGSRPDVAAAFPGYGANHGFAASFPIASGTHQVCIYAIDQGLGENRLLACRTVTA